MWIVLISADVGGVLAKIFVTSAPVFFLHERYHKDGADFLASGV